MTIRTDTTTCTFATCLLLTACAALNATSLQAQVASPLSPLSRQTATDAPKALAPATALPATSLRAASTATLAVKQIEVKPGEFPPFTGNQIKVAFECRIGAAPAQTDYSKFPRYTCFLDQKRTADLNQLPIRRVDYFPSGDGITTKVTVVADRTAVNARPGRIRAAFQLMHEPHAGAGQPVLKDFVFADGLISP